MKNPFKFVKEKPAWDDLWLSVKNTYRSSIEEYDPEQIQVGMFFFLSLSDWSTARLINSEKEVKFAIRKIFSKYEKGVYLEKYFTYIPNPDDIPSAIYLTYLTNPNPDDYRKLFDGEPTDEVATLNKENKSTVLWDLYHRKEILEKFTEYVTIDPSRQPIVTTSKNDMEELIFLQVLRRETRISPFILGGQDEASL